MTDIFAPIEPIQDEYDPAPIAEIIRLRSYSRYLPEARRNETWNEMVDRVLYSPHLGIKKLGKFTPEEIKLIDEEMRNRRGLGSSRAMWVQGTEWWTKPANAPGTYNCFAAETPVLTLEHGILPIRDLVGKATHVLNKLGTWVPVEFKSYGWQKLIQVDLIRGESNGERLTVRATPEHNWITTDGVVVNTQHLKRKSRLLFNPLPKPEITNPVVYNLGVEHGIIFGDGSVAGTKNPWNEERFKVRLCKEKVELLPFFEGRQVIYPPSCKGDPIIFVEMDDFVYFTNNGDLKDFPTTNDTDYLLGFIRGLIATDGGTNKKGYTPVVDITGTHKVCSWIEKNAHKVGFLQCGSIRETHKKGQSSNFGERKESVWEYKFYVGTVTTEDLLRAKHREGFGDGLVNPPVWKVHKVSELLEAEEVFCCEEPETHTFTLSGGLLTGNCTSFVVTDWDTLRNLTDLAMQGCGTGAVIEPEYIRKLPSIKRSIDLEVYGKPGELPKEQRSDHTSVHRTGEGVLLTIGDSREGWADAYTALFELASDSKIKVDHLYITLDMRHVRPEGEQLKGFGGVANPNRLQKSFENAVRLINKAVGRQLTSVEVCLAIDEAASAVVAGNIRRSAGMRQGSSKDEEFAAAKDNLWQDEGDGNWSIDPVRDALRMANHTRVFHHKPSLEECIEAVRKQFYSGEGAIEWAGEAVARGNADVLVTREEKLAFIALYNESRDKARSYLQKKSGATGKVLEHRMGRYGLNPLNLAA